MKEFWRKVEGYEEDYIVSTNGRIWNIGGRRKSSKPIKPIKLKNGYYGVKLSHNGESKTYYVHRIVAKAFPEMCREYFKGAEVDHKDKNKANNKAENLEWVTKNENRMRESYGYGYNINISIF